MLRIATKTDDQTEELIHTGHWLLHHVHRELGPGLVEAIYHAQSLSNWRRPTFHSSGKTIPVRYRDKMSAQSIDSDLVVDERLVLELEAVERSASGARRAGAELSADFQTSDVPA
jgi:GxxExxY protein